MAPPFDPTRPISGPDLLRPTDGQLVALTRGLAEHRLYVLNHEDIRPHLPPRLVQEMLAEPNPVTGMERLLAELTIEGRRELRDACAGVIEGYRPLRETIQQDKDSTMPHRLEESTRDKLRQELRPVIEERYRDAECMPGTREGILAELVDKTAEALETPNKLVWIHGVAGSGKTSIMGSLAPRLRKDSRFSAVSLFTCARDVEARRFLLRILPSIAWDLAHSIEGFGRDLAARVAAGDRLQFLQLQLTRFILEPWRHSGSPTTVILIDALDECDDVREVRALLDAISSSVHASERIAFVLASRHVPPLSDHLDQSPVHFVCDLSSRAYLQSANSDIELYIRTSYRPTLHTQICRSSGELTSFEVSHDLAVQRIRDQSSGIFMCAFVVCSALQSDSSRVDLLLNIMTHRATFDSTDDDVLYRMYRTALSAAFHRRYPRAKALEDAVTLARRVLGIILCAANPLTVGVIARFAGPGSSTEQVVQVLHLCRPLFAWHERDGPVVFMHASVADFLLSSESGCRAPAADLDFSLDPSRHNLHMARRCLAVLQDDLHFNMYGLRHPEEKPTKVLSNSLLYASINWVDHLPNPYGLEEEIRRNISRLLQTCFLFWLEVLAARSEVEVRGVPMMQRLLDILGPEPDAFVVDCERFLRHLHSYMTNGPASVYLHALPFAPATAQVLQRFDTDPTFAWLHATGPIMLVGRSADWPAEYLRWTVQGEISDVVAASIDDHLLVGFRNGFIALVASSTGHGRWCVNLTHRLSLERYLGYTSRVDIVACTGASATPARFAATSRCSGPILIGDLSSGRPVAGCALDGAGGIFGRDITSICYSPDGACLVACSQDGAGAIWNLATPQAEAPEFTIPLHLYRATRTWAPTFPLRYIKDATIDGPSPFRRIKTTAIDVSRDCCRLLIATESDDSLGIEVAEMFTGRRILSCSRQLHNRERVLAAALSPDGLRVLVALSNMQILSADTDVETLGFRDVGTSAGGGLASAASFAEDSATVCFIDCLGETVFVRDIASGHQRSLEIPTENDMRDMRLLPRSSASKHFALFVVRSGQSTITIWDRPTLRPTTLVARTNRSDTLELPAPAFSPNGPGLLAHAFSYDGHWLATGKSTGRDLKVTSAQHLVQLWRIESLKLMWTTALFDQPWDLTFSPTNLSIVVRSHSNLVILETSSGSILYAWPKLEPDVDRGIAELRFSHDGRHVAWWETRGESRSGTLVYLLGPLFAEAQGSSLNRLPLDPSPGRDPSLHETRCILLPPEARSARIQVYDWRVDELAISTDGRKVALSFKRSHQASDADIPPSPRLRCADAGATLSIDDVGRDTEFYGRFGAAICVKARFTNGIVEMENAAPPRSPRFEGSPEGLGEPAPRGWLSSSAAQEWLAVCLGRGSRARGRIAFSLETNTICFNHSAVETGMIHLRSSDPWKAMNDAYKA